MAEMYKTLTKYLPMIVDDKFGKWIIDRENDGSKEHPMQFPFVAYSEMVNSLVDDIYSFEREHPEYCLHQYGQILEQRDSAMEPYLIS